MSLLRRWSGSFIAALRFLTILPLPGSLGTSEKELAGSLPFFPLIGLLLGSIAVPAAWALHLLLPPLVAAVLITMLLLAFSGGLHLDGLADTADGFFSARPREKMLEIMRDSATGAMGVIALILLLLLKVSCLASLNNSLIFAVFLMPIAGRSAILLLMALLPYVRPDGGLATLFYSRKSKMTALWGLLFFAGMAWATAGLRGMAAVLAVLLVTGLFALVCRNRINGATGDTLGAACELAEAAVALVFVSRIGGV
jgi:adenosylcobinamide-GDP ribazoletransferase